MAQERVTIGLGIIHNNYPVIVNMLVSLWHVTTTFGELFNKQTFYTMLCYATSSSNKINLGLCYYRLLCS